MSVSVVFELKNSMPFHKKKSGRISKVQMYKNMWENEVLNAENMRISLKSRKILNNP